MSYNQLILIGYVGKDPEVVNGASVPIAKFSVATSSFRQGKTETEWHNVTTFGKTAEACMQHLTKGKQVFVQGRIHYDKWTDKSGQARTSTVVYADQVRFLGKKDQTEEARATQLPRSAGAIPAQSMTESTGDDDNYGPEASFEREEEELGF